MSRFRVVVASEAGFCWGVERALEIAREAVLTAQAPIDTLGPLIHNPGVTLELAEQGIGLSHDEAAKTAGTAIIRSHGVPREVIESLEARGVAVIDATCSFVKSAQTKAARLREQGYRVVVLGEPDHPEVLGIRSYAGPDSVTVLEPDDLPEDLEGRRVGVVVQTTQSPARLAALTAALAPRVRELRVYNTICSATERRQEAAIAMAVEADVVLVVGGRSSANTARLAELCAQVQPSTYHIESAEEIEPAWLDLVEVVGVTAGASTPAVQIERVVERLRELGS